MGARDVTARTGRQDEVATLTTETGQVLANLDGSLGTSPLPVRVRVQKSSPAARKCPARGNLLLCL